MSDQSCEDEACPQQDRAAPDVPELDRYDWNGEDEYMDRCDDGLFVLHLQATKIISAKDEVQKIWQHIAKHHTGYENPSMAFRILTERAEAAEAKLALCIQRHGNYTNPSGPQND